VLLDTNVVSEVMKVAPSALVIQWLNSQDSGSLFISSVTIGEVEYGLRILPDSKRRSDLRDRFETFVSSAFAHRVLDYDEVSARLYSEIMGRRKELGRPLSAPDGQIVSIAKAHGLGVATRNLRDFEQCGVELLNPFSST